MIGLVLRPSTAMGRPTVATAGSELSLGIVSGEGVISYLNLGFAHHRAKVSIRIPIEVELGEYLLEVSRTDGNGMFPLCSVTDDPSCTYSHDVVGRLHCVMLLES